MIPAIVSGLLSLFGSQIAANSQRQTNAQNWKNSLELYHQQVANNREDADLAFQRQKDLMQSQQDFELKTSDPSFQMQRMKDAGINPNLIAGQISPAVNTPSVPSVSQASSATAQVPTMANPMQSFVQDLRGFVDIIQNLRLSTPTVENVKQTNKNLLATEENIKQDTQKKGEETLNFAKQREQIEANVALTKEQKKLISAQLDNIEDMLFNIRPREMKKMDAEYQESVARAKKTLQDIENTNQMFPEQLATVKESLKILRDNVHLSAKKRQQFDKQFDHYMDMLADSFKLDKVTLENALNAAESSNVMGQMENDIMSTIRRMYDSIEVDGNDDYLGQAMKMMSGAVMMYLNRELRALPTARDMYESARDERHWRFEQTWRSGGLDPNSN